MTALIVFIALSTLLVLALVTTDVREERAARADAFARHPGNWQPTEHLDYVPLICPVCGVEFGHGFLTESGGTIGGWITQRGHECVGRRVA